MCCVCLRVCVDKRQREAIHTHAPGPCHVHVTVSWKDKRNHHQPSKRKFDSETRGASRQTVLNLTGMHKCVSAGRKRRGGKGGGGSFCNPRVMGVRLAAGIYETKTTIYSRTRGGSMLVFWVVFLFFFKPSIIDPPTGKRVSEGPKAITEKREEDQQRESFSAAAQNKRKNSQLEVTESCVCTYWSSNRVLGQNTTSGI